MTPKAFYKVIQSIVNGTFYEIDDFVLVEFRDRLFNLTMASKMTSVQTTVESNLVQLCVNFGFDKKGEKYDLRIASTIEANIPKFVNHLNEVCAEYFKENPKPTPVITPKDQILNED